MSQAAHGQVAPIRRAQRRMGLAFVVPPFILYAVFVLWPFVQSFYFSLTNWNGIDPVREFIGFDNYVQIFTDPAVRDVMSNTIAWVIFGTIAPITIGLLLSLLLWSGARGVLFYRTVYFVPHVLPIIVIATVWGWIYHPLDGWLNRVLEAVGLGAYTTGWLGDPSTAFTAVLTAAVWGTFGFVVVVLLTGLQNVDLDLVDASRVDGANALQRTRHVIIPQIAPILLMVTTVTLIGGFSVFDIIFIMTQGGPGTATEVLGTYTYKVAFQFNMVGYGTALALLITALSLPIAVVLNRRREETR